MPDVPEKIVTLGKIWGGIRGMPLSKVFATNNNRFQGGGKGKMAGKKKTGRNPGPGYTPCGLEGFGTPVFGFCLLRLVGSKKN